MASKLNDSNAFTPYASRRRSASRGGTRSPGLFFAIAFALFGTGSGCAIPGHGGARIHTAPQPEGAAEHYCSWYAEPANGVLTVGISAFWSAMAETDGDPLADRRVAGPQWLGRFHLESERWLPPVALSAAPEPGGVWDVLPDESGGVYFTTFFGSAGRVGPHGEVAQFSDAGPGLAEIAKGPEGTLFASRYRSEGGALQLDADGLPLDVFATVPAAPAKSVAWDAGRGWLWILGDRPEDSSWPQHPAWAIDLAGRAQITLAGPEPHPEIQFARFLADGRGVLAIVEGPTLFARFLAPGEPLTAEALTGPAALRIDERFAWTHDFVQDIQLLADGRALLTRWSGVIDLVSADGEHRRVQLPRDESKPPSLYYAAVLVPASATAPAKICATRCGDIEVVCRDQ